MTLPEIILLGFFPLLIIYLIKKLLFRYYVIWIQDKPFTDIDGNDYKNKPNFNFLENNIFNLSINHRNDGFNDWEIIYQEKYDELGNVKYVPYKYNQPMVEDRRTGQFYVWKYNNKIKAETHVSNRLKNFEEESKDDFYILRKLNFIGESQAVSEALGKYEKFIN